MECLIVNEYYLLISSICIDKSNVLVERTARRKRTICDPKKILGNILNVRFFTYLHDGFRFNDRKRIKGLLYEAIKKNRG